MTGYLKNFNMSRFDIILGYMFAHINKYINELYYASRNNSRYYYELIDNIIADINKDLEEELLETLNSKEREDVIQEIEHLLNQF